MMYLQRDLNFALAGVAVLLAAAMPAFAASFVLASLTGQAIDTAIACGLICFLGSVVSLFVFAAMSRAREEGVVGGIVAGMLVRCCFALTGAIALVKAGVGEQHAVGGWILYWYLTFLVVEVVWLARSLMIASSTQEAHPC